MTRCWRRSGFQLAIASWSIVGGAIAYFGDCALAQITPDGTLPNNSRVTLQGNTSRISGGTQAGSNLFHSFEQFSVPTNGVAFFNNALDVQNIISRVTGESISNIDGLIRANGTANLFLINPNGIIFGPNATLTIGGSFVGSTASSLNFADGTSLSATAHPTTPVLTVSVPLGLQFGRNAGRILVQGQGRSLPKPEEVTTAEGRIRFEQSFLDSPVGLGVQPGKTLALVGGDVALLGGIIKAPQGRIELGSVTGTGLVSLNAKDLGWALGYEGVSTYGDIHLSQLSAIAASGEGGGDIQVQGGRVTLTENSIIFAATLGNQDGGRVSVQAEQLSLQGGSAVGSETLSQGTGGNLTVNASESVELIGTSPDGQGNSGFFTITQGTGGAGDLTIQTGRLSVRDGANVATVTFGSGHGGTLAVTASDSVELIGTSAEGEFPRGLFTLTAGAGSAGDLTIDTERLIVRDGAQVATVTFGSGHGGTLAVTTSDSVELIGTSAEGLTSGLHTDTAGIAGSAAGDLTIATGQLIIRDGAHVSTVGEAGGTLAVTASDFVELIGGISAANGYSPSGLSTGSTGITAGDLTIATRRLIVRDGASVSKGQTGTLAVTASDSVELIGTSADGQFGSSLFTGSTGIAGAVAGDLTISTGRLSVRDGAWVSTSNAEQGQAGNLAVTASDSVELIGTSADGQFASGLFAQTSGPTVGGNLTIDTGRLIVRDGAEVSAETFAQGKGGDILVNASNGVNLSGVGFSGFSSGLFTSTAGAGRGGNITIDTSAFRVADGAVVDASTRSAGNGGNITVKADTLEAVNGGQILTSAFKGSSGSAGNITVNTTDSVSISGSVPTSTKRFIQGVPNTIVEMGENDDPTTSGLFVLSQGSGDAGNLEIKARSIQLENQGELTAETTSAKGGNIMLQVQDLLLLRSNSKISSTAGTAQLGGNGGNIDIDTNFLVAIPSENSDITANAFTGNGGNIQLAASGIFGTQFREQLTPESDITATSEFGVNGTVQINTPDVDPDQGLVTLPAEVVDPSGLIAQTCPAGGGQGQSEFIITGRGGLPPNPSDALNTDAVWIDLDSTTQLAQNRPSSKQAPQVKNSTAQPLVEATGWALDDKGQVVLTASAPTATPNSPGLTTAKCRVF